MPRSQVTGTVRFHKSMFDIFYFILVSQECSMEHFIIMMLTLILSSSKLLLFDGFNISLHCRMTELPDNSGWETVLGSEDSQKQEVRRWIYP